MKKLLLLALCLMGCGVNPNVRSAMLDERMESGTLCQGSRAWRENNLCGPNNNSGLCIRIVDGPFVLTELKSTETCHHALQVGIRDTYENSSERREARWHLGAAEHFPLVLHNSEIEIKDGESLFLGTFGYNKVSDNSYCYVSWVGYRPKRVR